MKKKIIIIIGPTGIGKSDLAINLAKLLDTEIISADSMQIYKGLDIGTGKVTKNEMQGVIHHLIDIKNFDEKYSVKEFVDDAKYYIDNILSKNKIPIIVGGTGLYVKSLVEGYTFYNTDRSDTKREYYNSIANQYGIDYLYDVLNNKDPNKAKTISRTDKKRIIRALEILDNTERSISIDNNDENYQYIIFALTMNREQLYNRINNRVEKMFSLGLESEVRNLFQNQNSRYAQSLQAIGYKEFLPYFNNTCSLPEVKEKIKQNSRRYAKRQLTWIRGMKDIIWIDVQTESAINVITSYL